MSEHDQPPPSIPAVLSPEQADRVRAALAAYVQGKTPREVAKQLGYARMYVRAFLDGEIACTDRFASRVALAVDVDIDAFLTGGAP